jgi:hypothetical protein
MIISTMNAATMQNPMIIALEESWVSGDSLVELEELFIRRVRLK